MVKPDVVVIGSIVMDLVAHIDGYPDLGETVMGSSFNAYPGGKGANQAVAAARMGARVEMIGRVGGDVFGQQMLESLKDNGVGISGVTVDPSDISGVALICIDSSAQNRIVHIPGANRLCSKSEVIQGIQAMQDAACVMLQLEVPLEVSMALAQEAHAIGKTVILDPAPAKHLPTTFLQCCDYITPNEIEARRMVGFPIDDVESAKKASEHLVRMGASCGIVTMGSSGAYYSCNDGGGHIPAFSVTAVDTVGAGDAFNGGLSVALADGKDLDAAVLWAISAGALSVTKRGSQDAMPVRLEVESLLGHK